MPFDFSYALGGMAETVQAIPMAMSVLTYVLTSLACYAMAQRRGIHHAWLSWVPVLQIWVLGSLADQYRYVAKGQITYRRRILVTLQVIVSLVFSILIGMLLVSLGKAVFYSAGAGGLARLEELVIQSIFRIGGMGLILVPFHIGLLILKYMALYDVYRSCEPQNAVLYLVLSIFISMTIPFFLFFNREKEEGMPPRKPQPCAPQPAAGERPASAAAEQPEAAPDDSEKEAPEYL